MSYNRPSAPIPQNGQGRPPMPPPGHNQNGNNYNQQYNQQYNQHNGQYNQQNNQQYNQQYNQHNGQYNQQQNMQQNMQHNNGNYQQNQNNSNNGQFQQFTQYNRPPAPPPGMQNDHGMSYAYSNNTGNRKALFIGINYLGSQNQLGGCINDALAMKSFAIQNFGYREENCVVLTDDQNNRNNNPRAVPTRANMIDAMYWLVSNAQPNDSLLFHYSGHGATAKDLDGDEETGYDETICPVDFQSAGMIIDDEMNQILVQSLPAGCRLTAFFDSCHSGTALDLPYMYSTKGALKEPNMLKSAGNGALGAFTSYEKGDISGVLSSLSSTATQLLKGQSAQKKTRSTKASSADVISLSGCKDTQTSADANENGSKAGAMSYAFLQVMSQNPNQSYLTLLQNVREVMRNKYSQRPQLSCSHPLDVNLRFTL